MERQVTVRINLQASGNAAQVMSANRAEADKLAVAVAKTNPAGGGARVTTPPVSAVRAAGAAPTVLGGLPADMKLPGQQIVQRAMGTLGLAAAAATIAMHGISAVSKVLKDTFDLLNGRVLSASDVMARAQAAQASVTAALGGERLTRARYVQDLPAELRRRIEAPGITTEQRATILAQAESGFRGQVQSQASASRISAGVEANLERYRFMPLTPGSLLPQVPSAGISTWLTGLSEQWAPSVIPTNTNIREFAIRTSLQQEGLSAAQIEQRIGGVRAAGIDLAAPRLQDAEIRRIANITGGVTSTTAAIAGIAAVRGVQQGGVPGAITDDAEKRMPVAVTFRKDMGDFMDNLLLQVQKGEGGKDPMVRMVELFQTLNETALPVLDRWNTQLQAAEPPTPTPNAL